MKMHAQAKSSEPTLTGSATKRVSFADLVGLKLEFVKTITPCSSEENLNAMGAWKKHCDINGNVTRRQPSKYRYLCPCFVAPSRAECSFMERVFSQNVSLENIACDNFVVAGLIRVTNLCYTKEVCVRFTKDGWASSKDVWADYLSSCLDGKTDKFTFRITVPFDFEANQCVEFAIRYRASNQEFWDNNYGNNYHIQCVDVLPEQRRS